MFNSKIQKIKGTRRLILKNQFVVSTGLPSLDSIIGGGIPVGSCLLIEEDVHGIYSSIIAKLYLAEGVVNNHLLLLGSRDIDTKELISTLPTPLHEHARENAGSRNDDLLRIAWRYQDLPTAHQKLSIFGNTFDFNYRMQVDDANITIFPAAYSTGDFSYESLLSFIKTAIEDPKFNFRVPVMDRTVLRITLCSLGTDSWDGDLITFLIKLRALLQSYCATCLITVPAYLFEHLKIVHRCEMLCDTVVELKSLMNDGNSAYSDHDGLLLLKKLPIINTWSCTVPDSNDWAFKFTKKRFIVEKLNISPEDTKSVHREEEDVSDDYKMRHISNVENLF